MFNSVNSDIRREFYLVSATFTSDIVFFNLNSLVLVCICLHYLKKKTIV